MPRRSRSLEREMIPVTLRAGPLPVPALLAVADRPSDEARTPAVLLLHGFNGRKERIMGVAGRALVDRGITVLAIDLPLHGERAGTPEPALGLHLLSLWYAALEECDAAIRYLADHPAVDRTRIGIAGYSVGGLLALAVAAHQPAIRALAMVAAGDLPDRSPVARALRLALDPVRLVHHIGGVPFLMVNGRYDSIFRRADVERLYEAAGEPRELRWLQAGHRLGADAAHIAAGWLAERLDATASSRTSRTTAQSRRALKDERAAGAPTSPHAPRPEPTGG